MTELENSARARVPSPPDFDAWLRAGIVAGWCGPAVCFTHDGVPTSAVEDEEYDTGEPCLHILRLYPDAATKAGVQDNHSPSVWRATNAGIPIT